MRRPVVAPRARVALLRAGSGGRPTGVRAPGRARAAGRRRGDLLRAGLRRVRRAVPGRRVELRTGKARDLRRPGPGGPRSRRVGGRLRIQRALGHDISRITALMRGAIAKALMLGAMVLALLAAVALGAPVSVKALRSPGSPTTTRR